MKRSILKAASAAVGSLFLASSAFAATVSTGNVTIPDSGAAADPSGITFPVPEFNPALGTLTDVSIDFNSNLTAQLDVLNIAGSPATFANANSFGTVTLAGPDGTSASGTPSVSVASGSVNGAGFTVTDFPGVAQPLSDIVDVLPGGNLSDYEGAGNATFSVTFGPETSSGSPQTGVIAFGGETFATGGTVDVTYTYTPVPEPTTLTLLGVPALSLLARRRRRA